MPITAICTSCQHRFQAPDTFAGKRVKCRHCGQVFAIPVPGQPGGGPSMRLVEPGDVGGDDLASLESAAGASVSSASFVAPGTARNGTLNGGAPVARPVAAPPARPRPAPAAGAANRDDEGDDDDDQGDEDDADAQAQKLAGGRRPNFPVLSYPGAQVVDQWVPLVLPVLGLGWLALEMADDHEAGGKVMIKVARFATPVVLYSAVIFPIVFGMLDKAARELRYNLPPNPRLRAFASYLPAMVFATALWVMGGGSLPGMIVGLVLGLVLSSALIFLLFRLRESEVSNTVTYGAGGFAIGGVISLLLIAGLNYGTAMAVIKGKWQEACPVSPYALSLPWSAKPPTDLNKEQQMLQTHEAPAVDHTAVAQPPVTPVAPPPEPPPTPPAPTLSPVAADLRTLTLPDVGTAGTALLQPLSAWPVAALLKPGVEGATSVVVWDLNRDRPLGVEIHLPDGQIGQPVVSDDGALLAHIVTFPRRSIHLEQVSSGRTVAKRDLDPALKNPTLVGFVTSDKLKLLLVRGNLGAGTQSALGAALGNVPDQTSLLVSMDVNSTNPGVPIGLPPTEATGSTTAICPATHRVAVATRQNGKPVVVQFDLATGQPAGKTINLDIDPALPLTPTGFAYSADGKRIGVLVENGGNASLLSYNADTAGDPNELDFAGPAGIVPKAERGSFKGNALASLDADAWVVYGRRLIGTRGPDVIAPLLVDNVVSQRVLQDGQIELVTSANGGTQVQVLRIDPAKYRKVVQAAGSGSGS